MTYEHNPMSAYKTRIMNSRKVRKVPEFEPVKPTGPSYTFIILCAMAAFGLGLGIFSFL